MWEVTLSTNRIDPNRQRNGTTTSLEEDVQWLFIKALNIHGGRLTVTSESGQTYQVDLNTKAITQTNSASSPPSGAIRDVPDAAKKALTNGTAALVKERSTGKLGIAIVHGTSGKVTILGAGVGIGNAGDDFEWMDSWQLYSKTRAAHGAGETSFPHLRGEASLAEKSESGSALIYWNGKRHLWPQQGV